MLEPLQGLPQGVIGFRAVGNITPNDYKDVLDPAIDRVIDGGGKVNLVYVIGEDFDRYSLGALWQDAKLEGKPRSAWSRMALVTSHDWVGHAVSLVSFLVPGEAKVFPLEQQQAAIDWAAGGG